LNGIGFSHLLQIPIPGEQEPPHVAREDQRFSHPAEDPQWGAERERINHERSRWLGDEGMVMLHFLKNAPYHLIDKVIGTLIRRDFGGEMLLDAKMDRFPHHGIPEPHDAAGHASNRALVSVRHRLAMEVNAERQIEAPLGRGGNHHFEANGGHSSSAFPGPSLCGARQRHIAKTS